MFEIEDFIDNDLIVDEVIEELETKFFYSIREAMKKIYESKPEPITLKQKKRNNKHKFR